MKSNLGVEAKAELDSHVATSMAGGGFVIPKTLDM